MTITVALSDDQRLFCAGCCAAFEDSSDIEVVGLAHEYEATADLLESDPPRVLLLDIAILGESQDERLRLLKERSPSTRILALVSCCTQIKANSLLASGCDGLVDKAASPEEILAAVQALSRGRRFISLVAKESFFSGGESLLGPHQAKRRELPELSDREEKVLSQIARGLTNQQIADELFLSVKTIETYRSRIQRKLGVRGRSEMYQVAVSRGLVTGSTDFSETTDVETLTP